MNWVEEICEFLYPIRRPGNIVIADDFPNRQMAGMREIIENTEGMAMQALYAVFAV